MLGHCIIKFISILMQIVYKCNEGARKEERREEMMQLEKVIKFLKMNVRKKKNVM